MLGELSNFMKPYPVPDNEAERIAALKRYDILDTEAEELFDSIATVAAAICNTPIALISLIDSSRQWFKAKVGLDAEETSRDLAFCAHAIANPGELLIVPDATKDPRFAENPLVTGFPDIRFYAGAPIIDSSNFALGTLCVIDRKPRELSQNQIEALQALSKQVCANLDLRIQNRQIEEKSAEAERANQAKSQFIATMSHEIRTPMNGLIGILDLLSDELPPQYQDNLNIARASADNLLHLVNEVLDFSKIEASKLQLEVIPFNLPETLKTAVALHSRSAREKAIELSIEIDPELPDTFEGDPNRIIQIASNLIGNAIKFTGKGSVSVRVVSTSRSGAFHQIEISVKDTGIGIAPEKVNLLFEPFQQLDSSTTRVFGGSGLGLSICQRLANLMKGDIQLDSPAEGGARFTLSLPLTSVPDNVSEDSCDQPTPISLAGRKVLIVDDNETNRLIVARILERRHGNKPDEAKNGAQAIQLMKANTYDIVFMDCMMPVLDGFEAARMIRQGEAGEANSDVPIVALTANARREDQEICLQAGMSCHLPKPVRPEDIALVVNKWLPANSS